MSLKADCRLEAVVLDSMVAVVVADNNDLGEEGNMVVVDVDNKDLVGGMDIVDSLAWFYEYFKN